VSVKIEPQSSLFPHRVLHADLSLTWVKDAGLTMCRVQVHDRPKGELLVLSTGPLPGWDTPHELRVQLAQLVADLVHECHERYIDPEPF